MNLIQGFYVKELEGLGRKLVKRGSRLGWEGGLGPLSSADLYLNSCQFFEELAVEDKQAGEEEKARKEKEQQQQQQQVQVLSLPDLVGLPPCGCS